MSMPVRLLNISMVRCAAAPTPLEAKLSSPGFAFASAISSCTLLAGSEGCAIMISGATLISET